MSVRLRLLGLAATLALALSACASGSSSTTPEAPTPTVVPPAALAFADPLETVDPALWNEIAMNDDLAMCLAHAAGSDARSIDILRSDLGDMSTDGEVIIADCLPGA